MRSPKALARRFLEWPRELILWFGGFPFVWFTLLVPPVLAVLAFWVYGGPPKGLKVAAMVLEVGGLVAVGRGLLKTQERFDPRKASLWTRARNYLGTFPPPWGRKPIIGNLSAALSGVGGVSVGGTLTALRPTATTEQRLEALEAEVKLLQEGAAKTTQELAQYRQETRELLAKERQERELGDQRTAKEVVELATGDLAAQAIGWVWLLFGAVLHGWPV